LKRVYVTADPRSLGAGRIVLAVLLIMDLLRRVRELGTWYTSGGLLPGPSELRRGSLEPVFSLLFTTSRPSAAVVGFVVCGLAYLMLLLGVRTRLAHVASLVCVLGLHVRVLFIQDTGDVVLVELCTWTMFLPTGRRYSWDSFRARLRAHQERTADDLARRGDFAPDTAPIVSLAVLALTAQAAIIYFVEAQQRTGLTWRAGSAVHYLLHSDGVVTAFGLWVRSWLAPGESRALTWGAWLLEAALPFALLFPLRPRTARHLAIAFVLALNGTLALLLNLGMFAPSMLGVLPFLVPAADWDALHKWWARRRTARIVIFDGECGVCFQIVRVLARLDTSERLQFISSQSAIEGHTALVDLDIAADRLARTIVVLDPVTRRRWLRAAAFAEIASALPFGGLFAWPLRLPGIRALADAAYDAFAARRADISVALGLAACSTSNSATRSATQGSLAQVGLARGEADRREALATAQERIPRHNHISAPNWTLYTLVSETLVLLLVVLSTAQVLVDNPRVTRFDPSWQPRWMAVTTRYLQFHQSWAMFAPDPPLTDANVTVDAVTVDGRHVDPLNEVASSHQPRPGLRIPSRLGQSRLFSVYMHRLPWHQDYFGALTEWILRYPRRTGRQADEIRSFKAYYVEDDSPPPTEWEPRNTRTTLILKHPPLAP
jgi:predicted DCC family thiol-disulfide oxidoreductase YuxK